MSPDELDVRISQWMQAFPERSLLLLRAVVEGPIVAHARAGHRRLDPEQSRLLAYKAISMRRAGKKPTPRDVSDGARFKTRSGITVESIRGGRFWQEGPWYMGELGCYVDNAYFVEYGSSVNAPYPFLRPAIEANKFTFMLKLSETLIKASGFSN